MDPRDKDQEYGTVEMSRIEWSWTIGNFERCERTKYGRSIISPEFVHPAGQYGNLTCRLLLFPHGSKDAAPNDTSVYLYIKRYSLANRSVYGRFECWLSREVEPQIEEVVVRDSVCGAFEPGHGYGFPKLTDFWRIIDPDEKLCVDNQLTLHFSLDFSDRYDMARSVDEYSAQVQVTSQRTDNRKLELAEPLAGDSYPCAHGHNAKTCDHKSNSKE